MGLFTSITKIVLLLWLGFMMWAKATPLAEEMTGQDLVNAAKLVFEEREGDNLTVEQKFMSLYALGL